MLNRREFLKAVVALTGVTVSPLAVTRFSVPDLTLEEKRARARVLMGEQLDYTWVDESRAADLIIERARLAGQMMAADPALFWKEVVR